jgi:putative transposase
MKLVATKLALNPSLKGVEYQQEDLDLLNWFSNVTDDPEKRKFIFSKQSFEKMESVTPREWLTWIRDEIQKSETAATLSLQKEMGRGFMPGEDGLEYKWELKVRFFSQSHSIRPKPLNQWNEKVTWIDPLPKFVPIEPGSFENRREFSMKKTRYTEEQIIGALKQMEAGRKVADLARELGVSEATIYTWKSKFGGLEVSEARRLKELEDENRRLKHMVADLSLDKEALKSVIRKNGWSL